MANLNDIYNNRRFELWGAQDPNTLNLQALQSKLKDNPNLTVKDINEGMLRDKSLWSILEEAQIKRAREKRAKDLGLPLDDPRIEDDPRGLWDTFADGVSNAYNSIFRTKETFRDALDSVEGLTNNEKDIHARIADVTGRDNVSDLYGLGPLAPAISIGGGTLKTLYNYATGLNNPKADYTKSEEYKNLSEEEQKNIPNGLLDLYYNNKAFQNAINEGDSELANEIIVNYIKDLKAPSAASNKDLEKDFENLATVATTLAPTLASVTSEVNRDPEVDLEKKAVESQKRKYVPRSYLDEIRENHNRKLDFDKDLLDFYHGKY